jgi:hypothetical protein
MIGSIEFSEWTELSQVLSNVVITGKDDVVSWALTPSKKITTSSLYKFLTYGRVSSKMAKKDLEVQRASED